MAVILLAGCSPKVASIYNTASIKSKPQSFYINPLDQLQTKAEGEVNLSYQLETIVQENLESKGLKPSSLPDIYVSFVINIYTSEETTVNDYNRYNYNRYNNYGYMDPNFFNTNQYKEGVLIIDIKNADDKLVWQGSKTFKVKSRASVKETLPELCREIIATFDLSRF